MNEPLEFLVRAIVIGVGATAVIDVWALLQKHAFGAPSLNWGLVGRWIGHFRTGRFVHDNIARASPVRGERAIGWAAHYAIGILFAAVLLSIYGLDWARRPTLPPALIVGVATVAAPFLLMQPGMGAGIAASKTPKPNVARLRSLVTHTVFGLGLYLSAWLAAVLANS